MWLRVTLLQGPLVSAPFFVLKPDGGMHICSPHKAGGKRRSLSPVSSREAGVTRLKLVFPVGGFRHALSEILGFAEESRP